MTTSDAVVQNVTNWPSPLILTSETDPGSAEASHPAAACNWDRR